MISKSQISYINALSQKKYRAKHGKFIVEGVKMVDELLLSDFSIESIFCTENYFIKLQQSHQKLSKNTQIHLLSESELKKISLLTTPNQVLAVVAIPSVVVTHKLDTNFNWTIVLEDIQDPGNLGTILRIADWFGITEIKLSANSTDAYSPKVVQASMGSIFRVQVEEVDLEQYLEKESRTIYGAVLGGDSLYHQTFYSDGVLVLGNESKGISASIQAKMNKSLTIPAFGKAESLNVAIATSIICSEISRNR